MLFLIIKWKLYNLSIKKTVFCLNIFSETSWFKYLPPCIAQCFIYLWCHAGTQVSWPATRAVVSSCRQSQMIQTSPVEWSCSLRWRQTVISSLMSAFSSTWNSTWDPLDETDHSNLQEEVFFGRFFVVFLFCFFQKKENTLQFQGFSFVFWEAVTQPKLTVCDRASAQTAEGDNQRGACSLQGLSFPLNLHMAQSRYFPETFQRDTCPSRATVEPNSESLSQPWKWCIIATSEVQMFSQQDSFQHLLWAHFYQSLEVFSS